MLSNQTPHYNSWRIRIEELIQRSYRVMKSQMKCLENSSFFGSWFQIALTKIDILSSLFKQKLNCCIIFMSNSV